MPLPTPRISRRHEIVTLAALCFTVTIALIWPRETQSTKLLSPAEPAALAPLEGHYALRGIIGRNGDLWINKQGRFHFVNYGCDGIAEEYWGHVVLRGGTLDLIPERPRRQIATTALGNHLRVMRWSGHPYLVAEDEISEFYHYTGLGQIKCLPGICFCRLDSSDSRLGLD